MKDIHLWGVKQNNLKDIDVKVPLGSLTVICGPSGSGKSSLAFQTLYAEGQRRYIESLSNYAKQFLNKAPKPDIEGVKNIPPAIAIEQKNNVKTSRSTVGTTTEIVDYLRLLYEKIGKPHCPKHKVLIESDHVSSATQKVVSELDGKRGYVLSPIYKDRRVLEGKKLHSTLLQDGFLRIYVPPKKKATGLGDILDLDSPETVKKGLPKDLFYIVIDRSAFRKEDEGRIADSISQTYRMSLKYNTGLVGGHALCVTTDGEQLRMSEENSCSLCDYTFPQINSRLFSFNSPTGACPTCKGFGNLLQLDEDKIVPNDNLSLAEGALHPFTMPSADSDRQALVKFCKKAKIDMHSPWKKLKPEQRKKIWEGTQSFYGVEGLFEYLETKKYKMHVRVFLARYKSPFKCPDCNGSRLVPAVNHITIQKKSIAQLSQMTLEALHTFMGKIKLSRAEKEICAEVLKQIVSRLQFLMDVGVEYLTLDRETRTLSGGEYQRLNLANQLGMKLSQTLYVLDEPTVGLHPRDNDRLIEILKQLKELGNTLVVVEHDKDVIQNSTHIIEMGPGSGHLGGEVVYAGATEKFYDAQDSNTAFYIARKQWTPPKSHRPVDIENFRYKLSIEGCAGHNLKNTKATIPLNRLVVVTGVSGSGKSTLITQTLYPAVAKELRIETKKGQPYKKISGFEHIKNLLFIDQTPIGKSSRSNPVTYLKVYDAIRNIMSSTDEAKRRGYTPGTFSLNVDGGRCPTCQGTGVETIEMPFMDDIEITCDTCDGKKFKDEVLDVTYHRKNINQILNLTVAEAMDFFVAYPNIRRPLAFLKEVGLDYIRLGQSARSLSGGESQRLKIAREFNASQQKNALYILDEPTTGLHFREVQMLLTVLNKLIDAGGSVVVIEHNQDIVAAADYVIDMGPEAGEKGGKVLFAGTVEDLVKQRNSQTGKYLKRHLEGDFSPVKPRATKKIATTKKKAKAKKTTQTTKKKTTRKKKKKA